MNFQKRMRKNVNFFKKLPLNFTQVLQIKSEFRQNREKITFREETTQIIEISSNYREKMRIS